jgi:hypothetical protein
LKAARREFDRHAELRSVHIMGPEDLLGTDGYSLWQLGTGERAVPKNLQFMAKVAEDPEASRALAWFALHGYGLDGVHAAGDQQSWNMWTKGWASAPARGLPERVTGAAGYGKKSWMTETSGEPVRWVAENDGEQGDSALGIATKIHSALTIGQQSAWLYWMLSNHEPAKPETLTDQKLGARSPKYVAAKHYFRFIRPGAQRVEVTVHNGGGDILASAFEQEQGLVLVLINTGRRTKRAALKGVALGDPGRIQAFTSTPDALFQSNPAWQSAPSALDLPALSVTTLVVPRL